MRDPERRSGEGSENHPARFFGLERFARLSPTLSGRILSILIGVAALTTLISIVTEPPPEHGVLGLGTDATPTATVTATVTATATATPTLTPIPTFP